MSEATYTFYFPITTCHVCGDRDWRHVKVLGAVGDYCRSCASLVMIKVEWHRTQCLAEDWERGVFRVPLPMFDPTPPEGVKP